MSAVKLLRERHRLATQGGGDRGTSLVEVLVGMTLMVICGAIFTGAVVTVFLVTDRVQALATSSTQTNQAYQALDKTVRYAAAVSDPGLGAGVGIDKRWYVELRDTTSGSEVCIQLRLDTVTQQLQRRSWKVSNLATLTPWVQIASGVTNGSAAAGSADQPFVLAVPTPTANHQRLTITVVATSGPASSPVVSRSSIALTALNSSVPPPSGPICQQAGRP